MAFGTKMYHLTMKWQKNQKFSPRNQYLVKEIGTKSKKIAKETKVFAKKRGFSPGLG